MHKISEQRKCLQTYGSLDDKLFFIKEIVELLDKVEVLAEVFHKAKHFLEQRQNHTAFYSSENDK